jgi:hypothetical protein
LYFDFSYYLVSCAMRPELLTPISKLPSGLFGELG